VDILRNQIIKGILQSVQDKGRAPTAQIGAERAADVAIPLLKEEIDKVEAIRNYIDNQILFVDIEESPEEMREAGHLINTHVARIVLDIRALLGDTEMITVGSPDGSQVYDIPLTDYLFLTKDDPTE
jgi:hypothetical protein